jgi:hypothetical protein
MNDTFNVNFYIVTATINPIFFLALTLQGSFYNSLQGKVDENVKALHKALERTRKHEPMPIAMTVPAYFAMGLILFAFLIVIAALIGELLSLLVLYREYAASQTGTYVLWSTAGLILLTLAIPAGAMGKAFFRIGIISITGMVIPFRDAIQTSRANRSKQSKHELVVDKDPELTDGSSGPSTQPPADLP